MAEQIEKMGLSFLDDKTEVWNAPYHAVFQASDPNRGPLAWFWGVIRSWQPGNEGKEAGRWLTYAYGDAVPFPEAGDTWVRDILVTGHARLVSVRDRKPNMDELAEVDEVRAVLEKQRDPWTY